MECQPGWTKLHGSVEREVAITRGMTAGTKNQSIHEPI